MSKYDITDEGQKRAILKLLLFAASIAPVLIIVGRKSDQSLWQLIEEAEEAF